MVEDKLHKHTRNFLDYFPPPRFLEMPAVGLDITDTSIHFVEILRTKHGLVLGKYGEYPLEPGLISSGYVHNKEEMIRILRKIKDEHRLQFVNTSISEEKAYLFKTTIPRVPRTQIRETLEFKLEENVPISAKDAVFDYTVIEHPERKDRFEVGVSVLPSKVVSTYIELLRGAGLVPVSFEIEAHAISRAIVPKGSLSTFMVVRFGETKTVLSIVSEGIVAFTSTLSIGGGAITSALAKYFSVSLEEAAKIKHEKGFIKNRKNMDLFFLLMNTVAALKDEINKLSIYWHTHVDQSGEMGKKIERIFLCGKDSSLSGFDEYLQLSLKTDVEVAQVWRNVFSCDEFVPEVSFLDSLDYAAAVGLAIPREQ